MRIRRHALPRQHSINMATPCAANWPCLHTADLGRLSSNAARGLIGSCLSKLAKIAAIVDEPATASSHGLRYHEIISRRASARYFVKLAARDADRPRHCDAGRRQPEWR